MAETEFAMKPTEFVDALYRNCLGRSADPSGLVDYVELLRTTEDPTLVLKCILESGEYIARTAEKNVDCTAEAERALAVLDRPLRIVDAGAQSFGVGTHAYNALLKIPGVQIIGFDPLEERLRERAESEGMAGLRLLPYAVGDGGTYTFYVNNEDSNSSLFPLNIAHNVCFNHLSTFYTVRTEQITTRRLDDVLPEGPVDFLKLDVQGAELMVLKGAERTLSRTAVVHCEVLFSRMYLGQPLFPEVQEHLMSQDFTLIDLIPARYHYLVPSGRTPQDRLIWADAVFFRETDDAEMQSVQALVAASVYRKPTLAEYLLIRAAQGR